MKNAISSDRQITGLNALSLSVVLGSGGSCLEAELAYGGSSKSVWMPGLVAWRAYDSMARVVPRKSAKHSRGIASLLWHVVAGFSMLHSTPA
jgi:hypothetical protein